jgi:hypothetical protein
MSPNPHLLSVEGTSGKRVAHGIGPLNVLTDQGYLRRPMGRGASLRDTRPRAHAIGGLPSTLPSSHVIGN